MSKLFPNQEIGKAYKHESLPIYEAGVFDFFRFLPFDESFYGKSMMELHKGNLRMNKDGNRYSNIFPGQKVSYWSDSPQTARAEFTRWYETKNYIAFWAYDDGSSCIPTVYPPKPLHIIDGRERGFNDILIKRNNGIGLNREEQKTVDLIAYENPDCLVYESMQRKGGVNYMFFEKGFNKLSLRQVSLRLNSEKGKNHNTIICAEGSDYTPYLKGYCGMFLPKAKIKYDDGTANSDEIRAKLQVVVDWAYRTGVRND